MSRLAGRRTVAGGAALLAGLGLAVLLAGDDIRARRGTDHPG